LAVLPEVAGIVEGVVGQHGQTSSRVPRMGYAYERTRLFFFLDENLDLIRRVRGYSNVERELGAMVQLFLFKSLRLKDLQSVVPRRQLKSNDFVFVE